MASATLVNLTIITNFLCMAISLWFAIYLLARGLTNPLTFRSVVALFSLAFYFNSSLSEIGSSSVSAGPVRSLATLIALIAVHDLTHYLLPPAIRRRLYWLARAILLMGILAIVLLFSVPATGNCSPNHICPSNLGYPWVAIDGIKILVLGTILYNLYRIIKSQDRYQGHALYGAILLGHSTVLYSVISTIFNQILPRFIPNLLVLAALLLLLYSVDQNQILLTRRRSTFAIPVTLLTTTLIAGVYAWFAWRIDLDGTYILLLVVMAIFSHSAYDLIGELLDRALRKQEHHMRQELRQLAHHISTDHSLPGALQRGLSILCDNLHASSGWIATCHGDQYLVAASIQSIPAGLCLSPHDLSLENSSSQIKEVCGNPYLLVPADVGSACAAVIGIGIRKDNHPFDEEDLFWLEDVAEEIAHMIYIHRVHEIKMIEDEGSHFQTTTGMMDGLETDQLLSTLANKPDPDQIKMIENGFRFLNDYSTLGNSPLVPLLGIKAKDHIEAGKLVQRRLLEVLEKLRPIGEAPCEPIPREWHAYTILHDAYVDERLARDIMSKLYISEGTYFRLRRHALRGVTRVLLELREIA